MLLIAHKREDGTLQPLNDHMHRVADLASSFAQPFGASLAAYYSGMLHDLGKASPVGQKRMLDPDHTAKVDHSTAGAQIAANASQIHSAFCIAGHHSGLMDIGTRASMPDDGTLCGRLKKKLTGDLDYQQGTPLIANLQVPAIPSWLPPSSANPYAHQFFIRMLFSCLIDADFLDTEAFMTGKTRKSSADSIDILADRIMGTVSKLLTAPKGEINKKRCELLRACVNAADGKPGLFSLTIPTGGGKTLDSLTFALLHAKRWNKRRVIYVIPYTSIIEQNAAVFSDILGKENVLEHHSNVETVDDNDHDDLRRRQATENWDAPVIVTTAVQFFESLYASRTSRCRKLHHIADSVIIFDEAQLLPLPYLMPCVAAIAELIHDYGVSAILCTATQPALDSFFHRLVPDMDIRQICPGTNEIFSFFRRVHYEKHAEMRIDDLASQLSTTSQVLCIVNTRSTARQVFEALPQDGSYHLSTLMTPKHRKQTLTVIRQRLNEGLPCRVISTCLIEAGVDVDFPTVWREMTGLDSILQAAGRCNREGKRSVADSTVHLFRLADTRLPMQFLQPAAATEHVLQQYSKFDTPQAIHEYFRFLLYIHSEQALDEQDILKLCAGYQFKTVAERFHIIGDDTVAVIIPDEENADDLHLLYQNMVTAPLMRRLAQSSVNIYCEQLDQLIHSGMIAEVSPGMYVLTDPNIYHVHTGLSITAPTGCQAFMI